MHNIVAVAGMVAVHAEAADFTVVAVSMAHHAVVEVFMAAAAFAAVHQCVAAAVSVVTQQYEAAQAFMALLAHGEV
jgi:hypothetical protein